MIFTTNREESQGIAGDLWAQGGNLVVLIALAKYVAVEFFIPVGYVSLEVTEAMNILDHPCHQASESDWWVAEMWRDVQVQGKWILVQVSDHLGTYNVNCEAHKVDLRVRVCEGPA